MDLATFLRAYRKSRKLSIRKLAEILSVNKFRLEKWEKGARPNYEDGSKINAYFGVRDFNNFSEDFLKNFKPAKKSEDVLTLKDQLLEEKDKTN